MSHPINHIGLTVPDLVAATKWYTEILGFHIITPSIVSIRNPDGNDDPFMKISLSLFPPELQKISTAFLTSGNGVGLELFEFEPKIMEETKADIARDYKRGGVFHFAVTVPDFDATLDKAIQAGAKRIGGGWETMGSKFQYIADPWGNTIELLSVSFERLLANRGQVEMPE
ncbi:Glyoxalase/Bleomycin resistance protein/Dihydroxybiphenyl dioxygenase [Xylariaceae sp. FL1272]|nr:Glyoxalase/Bleomycin resistance protein/Dihydroxybiphenyl dioxygenase [Xylariaceae sp. FL1272]